MGPSQPGCVVDTAVCAKRAGDNWDSWLTRGDSDHCPSRARQLVDHAGSRTRARIARGSWSRPQDLGMECESPVISGRSRGSSDPGPSCLGKLVNAAGHRALARVAQDRRSTTGAIGHEPETAGTAG